MFWSFICLFHDIGYKYEEDSDQQLLEDIDDFISFLDLDFNLLEESKHKNLIRNYYKKRISGKKACLDHGIVGALLLNDALMDLAENSQIYSSIKEYRSFFVKICDSIAIHNMWRASIDNTSDYESYGLLLLIPGSVSINSQGKETLSISINLIDYALKNLDKTRSIF